MEFYKKYHDKLLQLACERFPLSSPVIQAYHHFPRHRFVPYHFSVAESYLDHPLTLYQDGTSHATVSQPSFAMYLIELLKLEKSHHVFEVGTGSGWNAALMSELVGERGFVITMESIPDVAQAARKALQQMAVKNVEVVHGDGAWGWPVGGPYDRIIFNIPSPHFPTFVKDQCKEDGMILFVQEMPYGPDEVRVFHKKNDRLQLTKKIRCQGGPIMGSVLRGPL